MEITTIFLEQLEKLVSLFKQNDTYELEAKYKNKITVKDFSIVLKYLRSLNYNEIIHDDVLDIFVNVENINYRISLSGQNEITQYCKTNILPKNVVILTKQFQNSLYFPEVNVKIDLKNEIPVLSARKQREITNNILDKGFRLKKRYSYTDPTNTFRFDLTLLRSPKINDKLLYFKKFSESRIHSLPVEYEIEIELINRENKLFAKKFINTIIEIYSIISNEENIISNKEKDSVLREYITLVYGKDKGFILNKALKNLTYRPKDYFAGPQPITLEMKNIIDPDLGITTIKNNYTVTEKADGERMLLYINNIGKCYFINNRLDIKFTGVKLDSISNMLFDGEYITKDVLKNDIKLYGIFDIYFNDSHNVADLPLVNGRLNLMKKIVNKIQSKFNDKSIEIFVKEFRYENIFEDCKYILEQNTLGKYKYYIDGLVFTPKDLAVGGSFVGDKSAFIKTWNKVFKWKPPQDNTIDFLVKYKNDDFTNINNINHKVLSLFVGYNPVQMKNISVLDYLQNKLEIKNEYIEYPFLPGEMLNNETFSKCYMQINTQKDALKCKNGDEITDYSIVEFAYKNDESIIYPLRWIPLRVRNDKTEMLRRTGLAGTANDFNTALNIWKSIKYPVTYELITGTKSITKADITDEDDIYYYRTTTRDKFASKQMMDYHNTFIKNKLLISKFTGTLFDLSCGKGGDLSKWLEYNYTKVLGVDISKDNIENPVDGIYARLIKNKLYDKSKHTYVFTKLDSSRKFTNEYFDELDNDYSQLAKNIWGIDKIAGLEKYYNFVENKFDVVSCQFSIHYFFENEEKLDNLIWNIDKHLKTGGYFIGTCLDGCKVKDKLKGIKKGDSINGKKGDKIIWNIRKMYSSNNLPTYGEAIDVYMESIGNIISEYLVNFDILVAKLAKYNIVPVNKEELTKLNLENSYEHFDKQYNRLDDIEELTSDEKIYSFMNMWFVFVKKENTGIIKKKIIKKI